MNAGGAARTETTQGQDSTSFAEVKLKQAWKLQLMAAVTVGLFVLSEWCSRGWHFYPPLAAVLGIAFVATFVAAQLRADGGSKLIALRHESAQVTIRKGNRMIFWIFLADLVGLFLFMVVFRGTPTFLTLFVVLTAVTIMMTCPSTGTVDGTDAHCRMCDTPQDGIDGKLRVLLEVLRSWCGVAVLALGTYVAGLFLASHVAQLVAKVPGPWVAQSDKPLQLDRWTMVVFALAGMVQIVYARYIRERAKARDGANA